MTELQSSGLDFLSFFWLLVIASGVAMLGRYIRIPYALALVITGLIIGPVHILPQVHLYPEILLTIFLPPLLFESALNLRLKLLRENWKPVFFFSFVGTVFSTLSIGLLMHWLAGLPLPAALVFGALISPTDPVSVIAILKELRVGKRLSTIMEAESLFNDGVAIVIFSLLLGYAGGQEIEPSQSIVLFFKVFAGGLALGILTGSIASRLTREFDDHLLEIMLTTIVAFGSFLLAESLHVSGVIAVVAAGLTVGSYGMPTGMSPTTRLAVSSFWEYAAFAANSIIFLLVGLEVTFVNLSVAWKEIGIGIIAILVSRSVAIYLLSVVVNWLKGEVPFKWQHVLIWGGVRGALPMALVLGLGFGFPQRSELVVITFGVVLFSLLVQGLSIKALIKQLGLSDVHPSITAYSKLASRLLAIDAALDEIIRMEKQKAITPATHDELQQAYRQNLAHVQESIEQLRRQDPQLTQYQEREARILALRAEKSALQEAERIGMLDLETLEELNTEIDQQLEELRSGMLE